MRASRKKNQQGFTLMEAVVAASVFAFIVVSTLGIYLTTIRLDARSRSERAVQQNARFIMDFLAKEIRNGSINYGQENDVDTISIINQQQQVEVVQYDAANQVLLLTKDGLGPTALSSSDVKITRFQAYLTPDLDPFEIGNNTHYQPHVTVVMRLESVNQKPTEMASMDLQSTFATREYPSRQ